MDPGRLDSCWTDTASWQLERERETNQIAKIPHKIHRLMGKMSNTIMLRNVWMVYCSIWRTRFSGFTYHTRHTYRDVDMEGEECL